MASVKAEQKENRMHQKVDQKGKLNAKPGVIEWIVGTISALLVLAMIAFLLYQAFNSKEGIPSLVINVDQVMSREEGHHVEFRITNEGDATAAEVLVKGRLRDGDQVVEEREVTFDYVPGGAEERAALIFMNDPAGYDLEILPSGYREP